MLCSLNPVLDFLEMLRCIHLDVFVELGLLVFGRKRRLRELCLIVLDLLLHLRDPAGGVLHERLVLALGAWADHVRLPEMVVVDVVKALVDVCALLFDMLHQIILGVGNRVLDELVHDLAVVYHLNQDLGLHQPRIVLISQFVDPRVLNLFFPLHLLSDLLEFSLIRVHLLIRFGLDSGELRVALLDKLDKRSGDFLSRFHRVNLFVLALCTPLHQEVADDLNAILERPGNIVPCFWHDFVQLVQA